VGLVDGLLVVNPTMQERGNSALNLTMAGTTDCILMIEGHSDFLSEETMVEALALGHAAIGTICAAISAFAHTAGRTKKIDTLHRCATSSTSAVSLRTPLPESPSPITPYPIIQCLLTSISLPHNKMFSLPTSLLEDIDLEFGDDLESALSIGDKQKRGAAVTGVEDRIKQKFVGSVRGKDTALVVNDKLVRGTL
jgi:polyribonucleotide nucleotidyltransferase